MLRFALLLTFLAVTACAPRANDVLVPVTEARFSDSYPTNWQGTPPEAYPVHGIDLSKFQPVVDWADARAGGVNFAYIKATEGGDQVDPLFKSHWQAAAQAGVARGAYHFFYHCRPALEQARYFISHVPRTVGALPPALDMEWTPTSPTCRSRRDPATLRAEAATFLDALERHYGTRPILYTTIDFFEDNQMWKLPRTEFWLRSTAAHPRDLYQGQHWAFWQYSGTGKAPGIRAPVDLNAFAGSASAWAEWRTKRSQK
jgi:lysozyme